jgi:hypothetical protein
MTTATKKRIKLYLNSASDYSIVDAAGEPYTIGAARAAWERGQVEDCNASFHRLASFSFDVDALKAHYAAGKR